MMAKTSPPARWYMLDKDGIATLCADKADAEREAADAQAAWPHTGPHRAVQLIEADGRASHGQAPAQPDPDGDAFRTAARLGLTLRFYGGCAQSGMPGTPSAYVVVTCRDRAAGMREAVERAATVIADGGESQRLEPTPSPQAAQQAPAGAASALNGQLYAALGNLFSHLGAEGCVCADHPFVWDAMTALKRIDGGVYLDDLAVPVEPDAHRDDLLKAVQLLEDGEWAEHFAKTPLGMRLEDQIKKLHSEIAAPAAPSTPASPTIEGESNGG